MNLVESSTHHIRQPNIKRLVIFTIIWFLIMLFRAAFHHELMATLFMALILVDMLLAICAILLIISGPIFFTKYRKYFISSILVFYVTCSMLIVTFTPVNQYVGAYTRLARLENTYAAQVAQFHAGNLNNLDKNTQVSEDGQLLFFMWYGMLDNAQGIVYDKNATLLKNFKSRKGMTIFKSELASVKHMWGHWYWVGLT